MDAAACWASIGFWQCVSVPFLTEGAARGQERALLEQLWKEAVSSLAVFFAVQVRDGPDRRDGHRGNRERIGSVKWSQVLWRQPSGFCPLLLQRETSWKQMPRNTVYANTPTIQPPALPILTPAEKGTAFPNMAQFLPFRSLHPDRAVGQSERVQGRSRRAPVICFALGHLIC